MTIGIYMIENTINNKKYIGQSVNIERRWLRHKNKNYWKQSSYLNRAFMKYGIENFHFSILCECKANELDHLEIKFIKEFNTFYEGYNLTLGGSGQRGVGQKLDRAMALEIISLIEYGTDFEEIARMFDCSSRTIRAINVGDSWHFDDVVYPVRDKNIKNSTKEKFGISTKKICECGMEHSYGSHCVACSQIKQRTVERPSPEWLIKNIAERGFVSVGKQFGVSDNAVRKWCKSYGLPHLKRDIVQLYKAGKT